MKKKLLVTTLALIMLMSVFLTGCGNSNKDGQSQNSQNVGTATKKAASSNSSSNGKKTSVTFWTLSTRQGAVDPAVEEFNATNDKYEVKVSYYDTDGIKDALKVAASSGTLPNMWFNWGGSLGGFYAENGSTYDLTQYAKDNGWSDKFTESSLSLSTYDGKLAGYPTSFNVIGVFYRKDIFEQYGIEIPTTFEEFEAACATLKENGITPISTAGLNGWHVMRFVELLIEYYAGADLHDSMNSFDESYNNDAVIKALTKYKEFVDKGYFPEGFITASPDETHMAVFAGKAAMDIQGQWYDGSIIQNGQDVNNFGAFAFPSGGTNRLSAFVEMTQFKAGNTDEELDASIAFMDLLHSKKFTDTYGEYYNLPLPLKGAEMPAGQPNVPVLLDLGNTNGTFTITDQAFPTEVADALFNVQAAIATNEMTTEEGAAEIANAIEAYKNK